MRKTALKQKSYRNTITKLSTKEALTDRETEIMKCAALGLNNNEIAQKLYVSSHTVKAQIGTAFKKLSANNRTNAVYIAMKYNIIK